MKAQTFLFTAEGGRSHKEMALQQGGEPRGEREDLLTHLRVGAVALRLRIPQTSVCARQVLADTRSPGPSSWRSPLLGVRREQRGPSP